jgi:hypothetical protein
MIATVAYVLNSLPLNVFLNIKYVLNLGTISRPIIA